MLWVSDSTICIDVARGGRGGGLEGLPPPCGQLTRCFSAVAELLVIILSSTVSKVARFLRHSVYLKRTHKAFVHQKNKAEILYILGI